MAVAVSVAVAVAVAVAGGAVIAVAFFFALDLSPLLLPLLTVMRARRQPLAPGLWLWHYQ